jgi:hypothetical protein
MRSNVVAAKIDTLLWSFGVVHAAFVAARFGIDPEIMPMRASFDASYGALSVIALAS